MLALFARLKIVIRDDHIEYASGMHGSDYINKDGIYLYPNETFFLCRELTKRFLNECGKPIDCVVGPEKGGIILSQLVGYSYIEMTRRSVMSIFAEKIKHTTGKTSFVFRRGYGDVLANKDVLIVDDVINTGGSVKEVIKLVASYGGRVRSVGCLCNRGGIAAHHLGVDHLFSLLNISLPTWNPSHCPLCASGMPLSTRFGRGRELVNH